MHFYSTKTGTRLTENHPDWPKTAKGVPSKRPTRKQMVAAGGVQGVTDSIGRLLTPYHLVDWAKNIGQTKAIEYWTTQENPTPEGFSEWMERFWNAPADAGTDLHRIILEEFIRDGVTPSDEKVAFACGEIKHQLLRVGADWESRKVEVQFVSACNLIMFGGTIDYLDDHIKADLKTVKEFHPPYDSELAQVAGYDLFASRSANWIIQLKRDTLEVKMWPINREQMELGKELFEACLDATKVCEAIKESYETEG